MVHPKYCHFPLFWFSRFQAIWPQNFFENGGDLKGNHWGPKIKPVHHPETWVHLLLSAKSSALIKTWFPHLLFYRTLLPVARRLVGTKCHQNTTCIPDHFGVQFKITNFGVYVWSPQPMNLSSLSSRPTNALPIKSWDSQGGYCICFESKFASAFLRLPWPPQHLPFHHRSLCSVDLEARQQSPAEVRASQPQQTGTLCWSPPWDRDGETCKWQSFLFYII